MFHVTHHIHRIATIMKHMRPDCVGEEVGVYRCCICRKVFQGIPIFSILGDAENRDAFQVTNQVAGS